MSGSKGFVCCELQSQLTRQGVSLGAQTRGQGLHRLPLLRPQLPEGHQHFITQGTSPRLPAFVASHPSTPMAMPILTYDPSAFALHFQGAVESICIGEIRLGLRKPITQLGFTILTHGPILQLQISDLDVVLRQPVKSANKKKPAPRKPTSTTTAKAKGKSKGQAKWRLITSMASLLSLSIAELRLKVLPSIQILQLHQS